jgi:hypothetical protein
MDKEEEKLKKLMTNNTRREGRSGDREKGNGSDEAEEAKRTQREGIRGVRYN